ncbi:rare lipoprotein A [Flammeovirgaceae bacterium 311]|nr:rare lipoprotein A [Flammeovirgaceae bacterium 311]
MAKLLLSIICSILLIQACGQDNSLNQQSALSPADSAKRALDSTLAAIRDTSYTNSVYFTKTGLASYYGARFHGRKTASGEVFDTAAFTAAHRTLPFGTTVAVTNPANNRTILVKINDRGPHNRNRIIDLSKAAARSLGVYKKGVARVKIEARLEK